MARAGFRKRVRASRPFAGEGASLYVASGSTDPGADAIRYRNARAGTSRGLYLDVTTPGTDRAKTTRVASVSAPTAQIDYTIPAALYGKVLRLQVRTFADDVECEVIGGTRVITIDGSGEQSNDINGTAALTEIEIRDSGTVRLKFRYSAVLSGLQPETFTAHRTAGPSSPTDVAVSYVDGQSLYVIELTGLLDSSAYTYKLFATSGVVTKDLITGISFTADASGPTAPTLVEAVTA